MKIVAVFSSGLFLLLFMSFMPPTQASEGGQEAAPASVSKAKRISELEMKRNEVSRQREQLEEFSQGPFSDSNGKEVRNLAKAEEEIEKEIEALRSTP
ncbi:MAG: hypothetical protein WC352_08235 [Candidatus Omnitrophota bacterium]|jgi:hypothetical protein